jgi:hypothetical protein
VRKTPQPGEKQMVREYLVEGPLRISPLPDGSFAIESLHVSGWMQIAMLENGELIQSRTFPTVEDAKAVYDTLVPIRDRQVEKERCEAEFRRLNPPLLQTA